MDWLSILKTKPRGCVELVQDENEDTSVHDEVFQVSELVEPYRVAHLIDLEENSNFLVFDDSLVDVDAEVNVVLSSSGQTNVDEDDDICCYLIFHLCFDKFFKIIIIIRVYMWR